MSNLAFPELYFDGYKADHRSQLPPGISKMFFNMTPRKSYRKHKVDKVTWVGLQYFVKEYLINQWNKNFFAKPVEEVVARYTRFLNNYLGPNSIGDKHIRRLHALGYLPIEIWALPEGSQVPYKVAPMVYWPTVDEFTWLAGALETIVSVSIWPMATSATTAKQFRDIMDRYALETVGNTNLSKFLGHNFSYRGCMGHEAACLVDAGHLFSFAGSDTCPGLTFLEEYYNANSDKELVSCSVPANEHSVMTSYGRDGELEAFKRIIKDVYPNGIVSMISDSFDYWKVITEYTVELKDIILARNGKTVFRPDSGNNVDIIVGNPNAPVGSPEYKGTIECLWDIFGGTVNELGYKVLNDKAGAILGDGVNLDVLLAICEGLKRKGFATNNLVYGIGSFNYQFGVSRDTDGWAVKCTYCEVDGIPRNIFKDPKTDKDGLKKSALGLIAVYKDNDGNFYQKDQVSWDDVKNCAFEPVFRNSTLLRDQNLYDIRLSINPNF